MGMTRSCTRTVVRAATRAAPRAVRVHGVCGVRRGQHGVRGATQSCGARTRHHTRPALSCIAARPAAPPGSSPSPRGKVPAAHRLGTRVAACCVSIWLDVGHVYVVGSWLRVSSVLNSNGMDPDTTRWPHTQTLVGHNIAPKLQPPTPHMFITHTHTHTHHLLAIKTRALHTNRHGPAVTWPPGWHRIQPPTPICATLPHATTYE